MRYLGRGLRRRLVRCALGGELAAVTMLDSAEDSVGAPGQDNANDDNENEDNQNDDNENDDDENDDDENDDNEDREGTWQAGSQDVSGFCFFPLPIYVNILEHFGLGWTLVHVGPE